MIENIKEIETSLGIEEGKLTEMITSEEKHNFDLTPLVIEKRSIYDERISNIKKDYMKKVVHIFKNIDLHVLKFDSHVNCNFLQNVY